MPMTPVAGVLLAVIVIFGATGLATLTLLSARSAQPLVLALMAFLAMMGTFFLFGLAAGHIRLKERLGSSELLRSALDTADHGVLISSRDGRPLFANREFRELLGLDSDGSLRTLEEALAGEPFAAECLFRLMRAVERGEMRAEEFRFRDGDARARTTRWLRLSVRPLLSSSSAAEIQGLVTWQLTDITRERAREAEAVRDLETALANYESLSVGVLSVDPEGRISHLNQTLAKWLGIEFGAARDRALKIDDLVVGSAEALLRSSLHRSKGEPVRLHLDLVREDGVGIPVEALAAYVTEGASSGEISLIVLPATRATPAAQGAIEGGQNFARLFQSSPFGIATIAEDGRILNANAAFARMFPEPGQVEANNIQALVATTANHEAGATLEAALAEARAGRISLAPVEVSFGPESEFTRRLYVSPIAPGEGLSETVIIYSIDATEQKALEAKFAQSQKMEAVGKLAGGIAHDFNNVLTAIIGFSDLLLQTHRPTDAAYADMLKIKTEANRAARLVRQLLAFSRRQTLKPEVLDLGEVLTELSAMLNKLLGEKVDLKIITGRDLWFVKADKTQLEQVVMNLAVNARDAMPEGGKLAVRARNISERDSLKLRDQTVIPGEYVLIEVEDNGTGMTPEVMAKIFEPFFSTKDVGKGTGLGLSTVYGIVKQTGGYVFPTSMPGKGTTFRVYLPRHIPEAKTETQSIKEPKKEQSRDLTGTGRVLLVEDEDSVRSFAVRALKRQGYEVIEATNGAEALEIVESDQGKIDLLVSDVVMPEMDGPTMYRELRKTRPDLKVIFMSGYPDDRIKIDDAEEAHFAFLQKPFTLPQLAEKVKEEIAVGA
ncbi:MAG: ATP-binding protein [Hyphomicrobiaceae bacterium]